MGMDTQTKPLEITVRQSDHGRRPWMGRITGTDDHYGLSREFLDGSVERSKSGRTADVTFSVEEPGIYQIGQAGSDTGFVVCWIKDGEIEYADTTEERAYRYAELRDSGKLDKEARKESK